MQQLTQEEEEDEEATPENGGLLSNFQEKFEQIIENEEVPEIYNIIFRFLSYFKCFLFQAKLSPREAGLDFMIILQGHNTPISTVN